MSVSAVVSTLNRRDYAADRRSVDHMLRGLALVRSLSRHDAPALRRSILDATERLAAAGFSEFELQRLKNYARLVNGGTRSVVGA